MYVYVYVCMGVLCLLLCAGGRDPRLGGMAAVLPPMRRAATGALVRDDATVELLVAAAAPPPAGPAPGGGVPAADAAAAEARQAAARHAARGAQLTAAELAAQTGPRPPPPPPRARLSTPGPAAAGLPPLLPRLPPGSQASPTQPPPPAGPPAPQQPATSAPVMPVPPGPSPLLPHDPLLPPAPPASGPFVTGLKQRLLSYVYSRCMAAHAGNPRRRQRECLALFRHVEAYRSLVLRKVRRAGALPWRTAERWRGFRLLFCCRCAATGCHALPAQQRPWQHTPPPFVYCRNAHPNASLTLHRQAHLLDRRRLLVDFRTPQAADLGPGPPAAQPPAAAAPGGFPGQLLVLFDLHDASVLGVEPGWAPDWGVRALAIRGSRRLRGAAGCGGAGMGGQAKGQGQSRVVLLGVGATGPLPAHPRTSSHALQRTILASAFARALLRSSQLFLATRAATPSRPGRGAGGVVRGPGAGLGAAALGRVAAAVGPVGAAGCGLGRVAWLADRWGGARPGCRGTVPGFQPSQPSPAPLAHLADTAWPLRSAPRAVRWSRPALPTAAPRAQAPPAGRARRTRRAAVPRGECPAAAVRWRPRTAPARAASCCSCCRPRRAATASPAART
jgi:hypothetical protein